MAAVSTSNLGARLAEEFLRAAERRGAELALNQVLNRLKGLPSETWVECARDLLQRRAVAASARLVQEAVQAWPGAIPLRRLQGEILRRLGDIANAEREYRALLTVDPRDEETVLALAGLLVEQGRFDAAGAAIDEFWLASSRTAALALRLAEPLLACHQQRRFLAICEEVLAARERDPQILMLAGRMALVLGNFEHARTRLLEAADAMPGDGGVLQLLAHTKRYTRADDSDFARFRACWENRELADAERELAGFALGKAYDDIGDYASAATVLRQARALASRSSHWDSRHWNRFVDGICGMRLPGLNVVPPLTPVFVIGLPRSGTTLVAERLGRHPQIRNRGELNWIAYLWDQLFAAQDVRQVGVDALRRAAEIYLRFLRRDDAPAAAYVDKNPLNFRYLKLIDALFPNAKIIHCRRDPRDTALSIWAQRFANPENSYSNRFQDIADFFAGYRRIISETRDRLRVPVLDVEYEKLVEQPEKTLRMLLEFIGLPEYPLLEAPPRGVVATASVWQARQPIYRSAVGRWRHYAEYVPELQALF